MITVELIKKARSILGVTDAADMNMIRSAYRKLAKQYHPDRNRDDKSIEEQFKLITEAYEILCGEKNAGRYGILKTNTDNVNEPSYDDKSYWEWWLERFKDIL
ncbi:DnaJ domain-containing protein [Desulfosporosinus sp. OT]|uniref:DnaJ domain-containing protein n=1 Tax=Desulfosporosinus sp. OT TaxID=913865 RepID=UPI0002DED7BE|nr:DnaJ domain-containing protein [Desulfosporosinus sp. OT]